jgi:hypothetical protein
MIRIRLFTETTGGFFNRQRRQTHRTEWQETYQFGARNFFGSHQFKAGIDFAYSDYNGRVQSLPVSIIGLSKVPIERIDFGPTSQFDIHQNETAWLFADKWTPLHASIWILGMRFESRFFDAINECSALLGGFCTQPRQF